MKAMHVAALPEAEDRQYFRSTRGDLADLSAVLLPGERAVFVTRGRLLHRFLPSFSRWLIVVTDRRLVCVRNRQGAIRQQLHVGLDRIEQVDQRGVVRNKVIVRTQSGELRIGGAGSVRGAELVSWLIAGARGDEQFRRKVAGVVPPAHGSLPADDEAAGRIEQLESTVDRLTEQMQFLEDLLQTRQEVRTATESPRAATPDARHR